MLFETQVVQRVVNLEIQMEQAWQAISQLAVEMRDFKDEMREFKEEMREFKEEMREFKEEMREFKDEMREFKDEMREFKEESRRFRIESRKQWGELANKLGTMAEDLVAPSVGRILRQVVDCPAEQMERVAVRMRVAHPSERGRTREFDVIAVCGEYVLVNETRSRLEIRDVRDFARRMPEAREFLPEYTDKRFIGAIASLYVDESIVRYGEKKGLIVLGFGEDVMEVLNSPGFRPKMY